ncbi:MAG: Fic family protein [Candidatus Micrarchaeota archaeon]
MPFIYLDKGQVLRANVRLTEPFGQAHGLLSEANLSHYLEAVQRYGETIPDERKRLLKKAAFLLYHLAFDAHAFMDGNKRTALFTTFAFLEANGCEFLEEGEESQWERAAFVKEVAGGKRSVQAIAKWLDGRCQKSDP